jgi:hypothetical protein
MSVLDWVRRGSRSAPQQVAQPSAPVSAPEFPATRQLSHEELVLRDGLLESAQCYFGGRLAADAYHDLICAIYNQLVIGIYFPVSAWEPVIELNHFRESAGYCARPDQEFRMTPGMWNEDHARVLAGEFK